MGNRAVITWKEDPSIHDNKSLGIYVHWNGGLDSVTAFLEYCKRSGFREPDYDDYGYARLVQVICNYLSDRDGLSVGIDTLDKLDLEGDNGTYICKGWKIVDRKYAPSKNIEFCDCDYIENMIEAIDESMPEGMKILK